MGILNRGTEINIDPKAGLSPIKDVSEALKSTKSAGKTSVLQGAEKFSSTVPDPSDSKIDKGSWIKGGGGKFERPDNRGNTSFS